MNMMIMSRIIYIFLTALAVWSCSPETQGYVIPGPNQTITPTPVHEEQDYFCTVFDGIWSKSPQGDFYEKARFIKYGTTLRQLEPDTDYKYVIRGEDGSVSREGRGRAQRAIILSTGVTGI